MNNEEIIDILKERISSEIPCYSLQGIKIIICDMTRQIIEKIIYQRENKKIHKLQLMYERNKGKRKEKLYKKYCNCVISQSERQHIIKTMPLLLNKDLKPLQYVKMANAIDLQEKIKII